jgi:hypothetical protein
MSEKVKKTGEKCSAKAAFLCKLHPLCPISYKNCHWKSKPNIGRTPCITAVCGIKNLNRQIFVYDKLIFFLQFGITLIRQCQEFLLGFL